MRLTGKQAHVLQNLNRVQPKVYKLDTPYQRRRYQLDGWECTAQITALVVRNKVRRSESGNLARLLGEEGSA